MNAKKQKGASSKEPSVRQKSVLVLLESHPGATIQAVADSLGVSHTAACYILRFLERHGFIESVRHGRSVRHYKAGAVAKGDRLAPILRDASRARVYQELRTASLGGTSINKVALRLGLTFGIVKSTLQELEVLGLVRLEQANGRYRVQLVKDLDGWPGQASLGQILSEAAEGQQAPAELQGGPAALTHVRPLERALPHVLPDGG